MFKKHVCYRCTFLLKHFLFFYYAFYNVFVSLTQNYVVQYYNSYMYVTYLFFSVLIKPPTIKTLYSAELLFCTQ